MPKLSSTLEQLARHILKRSQQNRTGFEDGPFDSFAEDEIHASSLPDTELQLTLAILEPEFSEAALDAIRQWIKEARPPRRFANLSRQCPGYAVRC